LLIAEPLPALPEPLPSVATCAGRAPSLPRLA
jgi:hypothetical protein